MKVVEMNPLSSVDIVARALHDTAEKNVINARQRDADRKEREHHFLRRKLYNRLEAMEQDTVHMDDWGDDGDSMEEAASDTERLDEALELFEVYKHERGG